SEAPASGNPLCVRWFVSSPSIAVDCRYRVRTLESRSMDEPSSGASPPAGMDPEDRLDSWKEIAAYLRRDVTTVQRWEKREGMPVRRHVHDKLGSVYASRSELNAWPRGRNLAVTHEAVEVDPRPD